MIPGWSKLSTRVNRIYRAGRQIQRIRWWHSPIEIEYNHRRIIPTNSRNPGRLSGQLQISTPAYRRANIAHPCLSHDLGPRSHCRQGPHPAPISGRSLEHLSRLGFCLAWAFVSLEHLSASAVSNCGLWLRSGLKLQSG